MLVMLARGAAFPTAASTAVTVDSSGYLVNNFSTTSSSTIDLRLGTVLINSTATINGLTATSYSVGWGMAGGLTSRSLIASSSYTLMGTGGAISLSGNLTTAGAYPLTLTLSGTTSLTLPTAGTLATVAGAEALTGKTYNGLTITTSTGALNITGGGVVTTTGTFALSGSGTLNFGAGGQLSTLAYLAAAPAGTLTGNTLSSTVTASTLQAVSTISTGVWEGTAIANAYLATALTGKTYNGLNITTATGTLSIGGASVVATSGSFTLSGSGLLNFGGGGTLGSAAYTNSSALVLLAGGNTIAGGNSFSGTLTLSTVPVVTFSGAVSYSGASVTYAASTAETHNSGTSTTYSSGSTLSVSPGAVSPMVAKAWGVIRGSDGALLASHNVASTGRSATGIYMVTFSTALASSTYSAVGTAEHTALAVVRMTNATPTAQSFSMTVCASNSAAIDPTTIFFTVFGN